MKLLDRNHEAQERAAITRAHGAALMPELGPAVRKGHVGLRLSAVGLRVLAVAIVLSLVAAAVGIWWWQTYLGSREDTATPAFSAEDTQAFNGWAAQNAARGGAGYGAAPIVLTYHDISPDAEAGHYVISPEAFAAQMKMLREAGYGTLTGSQYRDYLQGIYTPPEQSVVITFDDGTSGLYKYADTILQDNGFTAISFLITASVSTNRPYYLTWQQVDRMRDSGRWSFQSHTDSLHYRTPVDGKPLPAMAALETRNGQVETGEHFGERMSEDIVASDAQFADHGLPAPTLFSYPFSAPSSRIANDAVNISTQVFADHYVAAFTNHGHPIAPAPVASPQATPLERLEVTRGESTRTLFERLRSAQTLPVAPMDPTAVDNSWLEPGRYYRGPIHDSELPAGIVRFDADTLTYTEALWAAQRTDQWTDYTLTATAIDLTEGTAVGLRVRTGSGPDQSVRLMVRPDRATVDDSADRVVGSLTLQTGNVHFVRITVSPLATTVWVDDTIVATVPSDDGRGGFSVIGNRSSLAEPFAAWTDLRISPV